MSDAIEYYKDLAEIRKQGREEVALVNLDQLKALQIPAVEQSKNVYRLDTRQGAVMYYPTSGKWQHRGRTVKGSVTDFRAWLKRNHML